jgi:small conductance mechanosensitive channel
VSALILASALPLQDSLNGLLSNFNHEPGLYLTRLGGAFLVALLTLVAGHYAGTRVKHSLMTTRMGPNPSVLLSRAVRFTIWALGLVWILAIFSVPFTALAAVIGVATLAVSLSLQDLLKNLIAGIYLLAERPFRIGDTITVQGFTGVIDDIQMRVTYLHTDQGQRIVIPNQTVFTQVVLNNTLTGSQATSVTVEAPRSLDHDDLIQRVLSAVSGLPSVAPSPPPRLEPLAMTPESVKWNLFVWLRPGSNTSPIVLELGKLIPEATIGPADAPV